MPFDFNTKEQALTAIYNDLDMYIRSQLVNATREQISGTWQGRRAKALLDQIRVRLEQIHRQSTSWQETAFPQSLQSEAEKIEKELLEAGKLLPPNAAQEAQQWHRLNDDALSAIADDLTRTRAQHLGILTNSQGIAMPGSVLRQADDYLRQLGAIHISRGVGTGQGSYAVGKALRTSAEEALRNNIALQELAEGINSACGIVDSAGRTWSLQRYSQMAARTGMSRAATEGAMNKLQEFGEHLYRVTSNGTLCYICLPYEGKTFSMDEEGDKLGYPRLNRTFPLHPNCRHSIYPAIIETLKEGESFPKMTQEQLSMDDKGRYAYMREHNPAKMQVARQGFSSWPEYNRYKKNVGKAYNLADKELRGKRYRYDSIESRRKQATLMMLEDNNLTYAQAMAKVTRSFINSPEYAKLRPSITPSAQRSIANGK